MSLSSHRVGSFLIVSALSLVMLSACGGAGEPTDVTEDVVDTSGPEDGLIGDQVQTDTRADVVTGDVVVTDEGGDVDAVEDVNLLDESSGDTPNDIDDAADSGPDVLEICGAMGEACCTGICDSGLACGADDICGCPFGLTDCGGACVSTLSLAYCGDCLSSCPSGRCANSGTCSPVCGSANGDFNQPVPMGYEWSPFYLTVADMNLDGFFDIVFVLPITSSVNVMLGNGSGFYSAAQSFEVAPEATFVTVGDINMDSIPDVVVTANDSNSVSILFGSGDGSLQPATYLVSSSGVSSAGSAVIADLDGDSIPDLAVANMWSQSIGIWVGNGDGTFKAEVTYAAGYSIQGMASGDFNGDSKLDLAVANSQDNTIGVYLGNGDATFQAQMLYSLPGNPAFVTIGDVDGDGLADMISAATNASSIVVWIGKGDGTFEDPLTYNVSGGPVSATIADLTGDGIADVLVTSYYSGFISLLRGNSDGTLATAQSFPAAGNLHSVAIADLDRDSRLDVVAAAITSDSFWFMFGRQELFQAPEFYVAVPGTSAFTVADMDVDGDSDLVAIGTGSNVANVVLMPRHPETIIRNESETLLLECMGRNIESIGLAYYAEAGNSENCTMPGLPSYYSNDISSLLTAACVGHSSCSFLIGDDTMGGDPGGTTGNCVHVEYTCAGDHAMVQAPVGAAPASVATVDLNADGRTDLVTTDPVGNTVNVMLANSAAVGGYHAAVYYATGTQPESVAVGDLNNDGKPDIVTGDVTSSTVSVLLGNGDGTFGIASTIGVLKVPTSVAIGDVTHDSMPDIVVSNRLDGAVTLVENIGEGLLETTVSYGIGGSPDRIVLADVSGDGFPDVVINDISSDVLSVLISTDNGALSDRVDYPTGPQPVALAVGDVSGDGKPDLVSANQGDNTVSVFLWNGSGTFKVRTDYDAGMTPAGVAIAEMDGDGRADLIVSSTDADGAFRILRGTCTL